MPTLYSNAEMAAKRTQYNNEVVQAQKPRHENFGVDNTQNIYLAEQSRLTREKESKRQENVNSYLSKTQAQQQWNTNSFVPAQSHGGVFGASHSGFNSIQTQSHMRSAAPAIDSGASSMFGGIVHSKRRAHTRAVDRTELEDIIDYSEVALCDEEQFEAGAAPNSLVFEEGAWEETGLTTTYDVPGLKTLAPSNSTIKHKIAKVSFNNIIFSHIIIGKLRQVAFLKARLRNASKITLLKGPLGLTLDGSFLGQATFPRCSSGETFSLSLGVDPAIQISYPKPTVRRSQSGIFSKEDSNVFTRSIVITNTKHNASVELTVLDQVPVSEDERLKIEITNPRGLRVGGEKVRTGVNADTGLKLISSGTNTGTAKSARASVYGVDGKEVGKEGVWGKAEATAKKGGEVAWAVRLMPGCGVKLALEYEMAYPAGEGVVGV